MNRQNAIIVWVCAIAMIGLVLINSAKADGYVSASLNHIDTKFAHHNGVTLTGGYRFNGVLSFEGRGIAYNTDTDYEDRNARLKSLWGLYFKGALPLTNGLGVYVLYGHTRMEQKITDMGLSSNIRDSGTSLGFGGRYEVGAWSIYGEYVQVLDEVEQMSLGLELLF